MASYRLSPPDFSDTSDCPSHPCKRAIADLREAALAKARSLVNRVVALGPLVTLSELSRKEINPDCLAVVVGASIAATIYFLITAQVQLTENRKEERNAMDTLSYALDEMDYDALVSVLDSNERVFAEEFLQRREDARRAAAES